MTNEEYQEFCKEAWSPAVQNNQLYFAVGLAGEVGEVCEELKKAYRDTRQFDREKLTNELGDVLWYLTNIASNAGVSLDEIIRRNVEKLTKRHGDSYKAHMSDSETEYYQKGPHIGLRDRKTKKHIKWVPKSEVPEDFLAQRLCATCILRDSDGAKHCGVKPENAQNCSYYRSAECKAELEDSDLPF